MPPAAIYSIALRRLRWRVQVDRYSRCFGSRACCNTLMADKFQIASRTQNAHSDMLKRRHTHALIKGPARVRARPSPPAASAQASCNQTHDNLHTHPHATVRCQQLSLSLSLTHTQTNEHSRRSPAVHQPLRAGHPGAQRSANGGQQGREQGVRHA